MMAGFLAVPLKKTSEVELVKPLKNLIASTYSDADNPADYGDALNELNKLRMNATWRTLDKHESSLEVMYRYYDQLTALEAKVPPSDIQIAFKWKDAFDKGSFFGGKIGLTLSSVAYEKVCILFNIGAMQSQIAASQNTDNDEALKLMAKLFQQASGTFTHLKNTVMSSILQEPTPDLLPDTLSTLSALMMAQAQESFFFKVTGDKMKDAIVAKVSSQCEDLYADALKQMQKEALKPLWDKDWLPTVAGKQAAYHGLAEYFQSQVAKSEKAVGEELARLQHALELTKAAETRSGVIGSYREWQGRIQRAYDETKKDNDFIYHEHIPDVKTLPPIGKAAVAKVIPVPEKLSANFKDLFEALMPVPLHQALAMYEVRKAEIVNGEIAKLRENTQLVNSILASLNLPAALEDMSGDSVPQSLKDKARTVRDRGGLAAIEKLLQDLPELLQRNKEILDEADRMLNDEQESDNQLRSQFKERWTRVTSEKLTEPMRVNATKYRTIINNATQADGIVREKFNTHKNSIMLLSKADHELQAAIPSANPTKALQSSPTVQQLRELMDRVEAIKTERDVIEAELKSATVDMKTKFLSSLAKEGIINEPVLSVETLGQVYGPLQKQVRESIERQEQLMKQIQSTNSEFCKEKTSNTSATQRESILRDLAAAYDAYMELTANLQEGTKFYNDLTQLLVNFQNKVNDFCFARKTEKEELMRDLQQSIANSSGEAPPPPPHATTADVKRPVPPPRPPPPVPSHAAATSHAATSAPPAPSHSATTPMAAAGAPSFHPTQPPNVPYPVNPQAMPMPQPYAPYPYAYVPQMAPMPTGYNPYGGSYPQQGGARTDPFSWMKDKMKGAVQAVTGYPAYPTGGGYPAHPPTSYPGSQHPTGYPGAPPQAPYPQQQWH